jgi:TRAP-type C4-dicarboxylate transport system permease small subunit
VLSSFARLALKFLFIFFGIDISKMNEGGGGIEVTWWQMGLFLVGLYLFIAGVHFVIIESRTAIRQKEAERKERAKRRAKYYAERGGGTGEGDNSKID